jgi:hypothetical protein
MFGKDDARPVTALVSQVIGDMGDGNDMPILWHLKVSNYNEGALGARLQGHSPHSSGGRSRATREPPLYPTDPNAAPRDA